MDCGVRVIKLNPPNNSFNNESLHKAGQAQPMKQNNMTTIIVHQILSQHRPHLATNNTHATLNMHYEYQPQSTINYVDNVRDRIRSRSYYDERKRPGVEQKRIVKNRTLGKFGDKDECSLSEPKVIALEFENFTKPKLKKDGISSNKSAISTHQYYSLMVDSMQSYIKKIEKGKQKKLEKCQKLRSFGVNIQAIRAKPEEHKLAQYIQKEPRETKKRRIALDKPNQSSSNQISVKQNRSLIQDLSQDNSFNKTISAVHSNKKSKYLAKKLMFKSEKKDDDRKIGSKLNRMFNHFYIILSSFGVYLNRIQQKKTIQVEVKSKKAEKKYFYYVGRGNNKNLIVSILKKRWWWAQSQDISSTNFVWTQLKIQSILQKQASMAFSELEQAQPYLYTKQSNNVGTASEPIFETNKIYNIFHQNHSQLFHQKLPQREQAKFLRPMKVPTVVHNHYEANYMLGNKKALFYNMTQFKQFRKENVFEYIPETYHVEKINSRVFKQFQKKYREEKKSLWIVKPGENSNRGQGIFVSDSIEAIKSKIDKNKKHTFIIQRYVKNNLTFQRRKFDIRTYLLMTSIGGVSKFYWYTEGYLRTSSQIYNLSDLDDPFVHLTNDAIQSNGDNYGKFEKGNKVTYSEFQRYLDINYPNDKYLVSNLVQRMKDIAREVVQATYFKIDPCRKEYSFELFGMDFLVDSTFRPWLLEVNTNPCLQLSSPVLQRLIPRMVENLFRIVVDPVFQPFQNQFPRNLACYIPDNIIESNRFELIFDSLHDRQPEWQAYSASQNANKVYEDENQQFDNDGEIIKIQD